MNSRWSWIFIFHVLLHQGTIVVHGLPIYEPGAERREVEPHVTAVSEKHANLVETIVGSVLGVTAVLLVLFVLFLIYQRRKVGQVEDGLEKSSSPSNNSGRQWFSRFGRFRRDNHEQQVVKPGKQLRVELEDDSNGRTSLSDEKLSAIPRYLRANSAFEREASQSPSTPLPQPPTVPRSARVSGGKGPSVLLAVPTSAPLARRDSLRSVERVGSPLASRRPAPSPLGPRGRKRDIIANVFRFGGRAQPPQQPVQGRERLRLPPGLAEASPDELARRVQEKQRAVAVLEAKSRVHKHHAHSPSASSASGCDPSSCAVDRKIQDDLAELRHEVNVLHQLLPAGSAQGSVNNVI